MGGTEENIELKLKFLDFCAKGLITGSTILPKSR